MTEPGELEPHSESSANRAVANPEIYTYLAGADTIKGGPKEFPDALDLELFEGYFRKLHEQRELITQDLFPEDDKLKGKHFKKGEGEVGQTIYYDMEAHSFATTESQQGDLASVGSTISDGYKEGKKLHVVDIHTHPDEVLPSVVDYYYMLIGDPNLKIRAIRAIGVLCPQTQIFAVATDQTPILADKEQLDKLLLEKGTETRQYEGEEGQYLLTLRKRNERIDAFIGRLVGEETSKQFENMLNKLSQGLEVGADDIKPSDSLIRLSEKATRVGAKAAAKWLAHLAKVYNRIQLQFAKEMGIKLYFSQDFRNFTAFPE